MKRAARASIAGMVTLFSALCANAQERRTQVAVTLDACAAGQLADLERALSIELRGATLVAPDAAGPSALRASVACASRDAIEVRLTMPGASITRVRAVEVARTDARVRARHVALALAELLEDGLGEETSAPAQRVAAPTVVLAPRAPARPTPPRDVVPPLAPGLRTGLGISAVGRAFTAPFVLLGGGELALVVVVHRWVALRMALGALGGVTATQPGAVSLFAATANLALELGPRGGRVWGGGAVEVHGAAVRLAGLDARGSLEGELWGPWTALSTSGLLGVGLSSRVALEARAGAGVSFVSTRATVAGVAGPQVGGLTAAVSIGARWLF